MKRLFLILLCLLTLALPASALSLNFQNAGDLSNTVACIAGTCSWSESSTGGNNYIAITVTGGSTGGIINKNALPMTYAAATHVGGTFWSGSNYLVRLYDSSYGVLATLQDGYHPGSRYEVKIISGSVRLYRDGTVVDGPFSVAVNPSYIGFGTSGGGSVETLYWDDIVYGDTESNYVLGLPETYSGGSYFFVLKKSIINPADRGLANGNTYAVVNSNNMTITFSKNNSNSEILYVRHTGTGTILGCTTVSGYTGSVAIPLQDWIFNNPSANYGSITAYLSGSPTTVPVASVQYISSGATMAWGSHTYSTNDVAGYTWNIQSDVWALSTAGYTFSSKIIDVYGTVVSTSAISTQTGSGYYTFSSSNSQGVYYVALIATDSGGNEVWVAYDYTTLTGYLEFTGTVYDGDTTNIIPVADINITQGSVYYHVVTSAGTYSTGSTPFGTGAATTFNVTATNYRQYNYTVIPMSAKTAPLDFTLTPVFVATSGAGLGGVNRDNTYGRPIPYDNVYITNASYGESYMVTGNVRGFYLADQTDGIYFTYGRWYSVVASRSGYDNSSAYLVQVV